MGGPKEAQSPVDETEQEALEFFGQLYHDVRAERVDITDFSTWRSVKNGRTGKFIFAFIADCEVE